MIPFACTYQPLGVIAMATLLCCTSSMAQPGSTQAVDGGWRDQVRAGLESPHVCISYGGDPATVPGLPGYADLAAAVQEKGAEILISMMSNTAAVNVGTGAVSLAFAAGSHTFH